MSRALRWSAAGGLVLGLASTSLAAESDKGRAAAEPVVARSVYLMGTRATLATRARERDPALLLLGELLEELEAAEAALSTWRDDSLPSRLNRQAPGEPMTAPAWFCDLLEEVGGWRQATAGAFDPGVGRLVEAWDLRGAGRRPAAPELERALADSGVEHLAVLRSPCRVTREREVWLDTGAFGKGAAVERAERRVSGPPLRSWMIDLGGQVSVGGSEADPWPVALAHPQDRQRVAFRIELAAGSLATSGGSERDVRVGDETLGHVLDPRTGRPISRPGSVTVWHPRPLIADVLSTALYVMGPTAGLAWAEARGVAACFLEPSGTSPGGVEVRVSPAFRERFGAARAE